MKKSISLIAHSFAPTYVSITQDLSFLSGTYKTTFLSHTFSSISYSSLLITFFNILRPIFFLLLLLVREIYRELFVRNFVEHLVGVKMSGKGQSQSAFVRFITSPIRALGRARDFYVRSITKCGHSMNYSNPVDPVGSFSAFPRSYSVATSRSDESEDFAELMRAASARTLADRINMDLVLILSFAFVKVTILYSSSCMLILCLRFLYGMLTHSSEKPNEFGEKDEVSVWELTCSSP